MWAYFTHGLVLNMTLAQALNASHQGQCDEDVSYLSGLPAIRRQLAKLNADDIRRELKEYGAWDEAELSDDAQNVQRLLWLAAGQIVDEAAEARKARRSA